MASHQSAGSASFSLFPNPNTSMPRPVGGRSSSQASRGRRSESRERRAFTPQLHDRRPSTPHASPKPSNSQFSPSAPSAYASSPPQQQIRHASEDRTQTPQPFEPAGRENLGHDGHSGGFPLATQQGAPQEDVVEVENHTVRVQQPRLTIEVPGRSETAFSQAPTLVYPGNAGPSRSSIAKIPFPDDPSVPPHQPNPQPIQSLFPTYNPEVPLQQQNYGPVQMGSSSIPRAVISRQSYFEGSENAPEHPAVRSPGFHRPMRSQNQPPVIPKTCTTDQLKDLWKVANGWKASGSEGRVFCLKLSQQRDAPVYSLSSASQPFYNLTLDPTSTSAYVSLSRYDPSKPFKTSKPGSNSSPVSNRNSGSNKHWQEALNTTMEEESRKHPPNDGLVAMLMPVPAMKMAIEKPDDQSAVNTATKECARLVWDDDSDSHYLVHPAIATPFRMTVEHCPAWSRVEYTLEHHESPQHLAKLTRDGTGGGWLEIDTGVASRIDAFYVIDVAVAALLIVAAADDRKSPASVVEPFDAPPAPEPPKQSRSLSSALSRHRDDDEGSKKKSKKDKKRPRLEQFEVDIESQDDSYGGKEGKKTKDDEKMPFLIRVVAKLCKGVFACFIWLLSMAFGCVKGVFKVLYKCVGSKY